MNSKPNHDVTWILSALQNAVELEFSTLPLYLSSMFSLEVQNYKAYNLIRSVAMEEMVHMAIAANVLAAIGGKPDIKGINIKYPVKGLPGGAEPDLQIGLAQYCKPQIKNFMRIEAPLYLVQSRNLNEEYPTISKFYTDIKNAIIGNGKEIATLVKKGGSSSQVGDNIGFTTFSYQEGKDPIQMICAGIDEILEQGEGNTNTELITSSAFEYEESHYAKFAAMYYGHDYRQPEGAITLNSETEPLFFKGSIIGWPEVINTLAVPSDGYEAIFALDPNGKNVKQAIQAFDQAFSDMLNNLDLIWNGPQSTAWPTFGKAVHGMVDFRVLSCFNIMRSQIPVDVISKLSSLYPKEYDRLATYSDLSKPLFYGPRFWNINQ